jgi:uncharacterized protein
MRQPPSIDAWGGGGFRVAGLWRPGSLLIVDDKPVDWAVGRLSDLTLAHFEPVFAAGAAVEFVLLGTGLAQALPGRDLREGLRARGLGLEFMSSEAAARNYNILASDGRRLAAALIAV